MMKNLLIIFAAAVLMTACSENEKDFKRLDAFSVSTNSEYTLTKEVFLKTRQVLDNRNPIGSNKDWKGDAKLKIRLYINNKAVDTAISTTFPNVLEIQGYRLTLHSIYPYPELNKARNQKDYSVQLTLEKAD